MPVDAGEIICCSNSELHYFAFGSHCREFKQILRYYNTMTAIFLLWQSRAYKFLTLFQRQSPSNPNLTIIWHTASTPETLIAFPTQYHHHSIMPTSQSTSISLPQTHTFNVYTINPRSYHYLITRYEPALTRPQRAYLLDPNRQSSKSPKCIYHQPGDPIILYPGLTQLDYIGDK